MRASGSRMGVRSPGKEPAVPPDAWNPVQYEKFRAERMQPYHDLVGLIRPQAGMRVVDLGCGTGELTAMLAETLQAATVLGVDSSAAMLEQARDRANERVRFELVDIRRWQGAADCDLVFSNAALQWVPDNAGLLGRILAEMPPGSQIAVQVPRNEAHPSHRLAALVAQEAPFRDLLGGYVRQSEVLSLEAYAELLYEHGFEEQVCCEKIYGHVLPETGAVVEWVKGTLLTAYLGRLGAEAQEAFLATYRDRLLSELGDRTPFFYPFRRTLFWAMKRPGR